MRLAQQSSLLLIVLTLATACGTPCERIADRRMRFLQRAPSGQGPHLSILVPFAWANSVSALEVARLKPFSIDLGHLSPVPGLSKLSLFVKSVRWVPAPLNRIGLEIHVGLQVGRLKTAALRIDAELPMYYDPNKRELRATLTAASLRSIEPRIETGVAAVLAEGVRKKLPKQLRSVVTSDRLERWSNELLKLLVTDSYSLLRSTLLERLGTLHTFRIQLPELPLGAVELHTRTDARSFARVDITTTLPGDSTVGSLQPPRLNAKGHQFRVAIALPTVAELGNWAMSRGFVPSRYNERGDPGPDAEYEVALGWEEDSRPFKALVWNLSGGCFEARFGGYMGIAVHKDQVAVEVTDGRLEKLLGPPGANLAVLLEALWAPTVSFTRTAVASVTFAVGRNAVTLQLRRAQIQEPHLLLDGILKSKRP